MANRDVWKVKAFRTNMDGRSIMASEGNSVTTQSSEDAAYATIGGTKPSPQSHAIDQISGIRSVPESRRNQMRYVLENHLAETDFALSGTLSWGNIF